MADETEQDAPAEKEQAPKAPEQKSPIIMIVVGAVVGIVVIIALLLFTPLKSLIGGGSNDSVQETEEERLERIQKESKDIVFLPLPEIIVNLKNTGKGRGNVLKAIFVLELSSEKDREHINKFTPLITDQFQTFLREMEMIDLQGASGIEKTRSELETRINQVIAPVKIRQILIKDFLVQ